MSVCGCGVVSLWSGIAAVDFVCVFTFRLLCVFRVFFFVVCVCVFELFVYVCVLVCVNAFPCRVFCVIGCFGVCRFVDLCADEIVAFGKI